MGVVISAGWQIPTERSAFVQASNEKRTSSFALIPSESSREDFRKLFYLACEEKIVGRFSFRRGKNRGWTDRRAKVTRIKVIIHSRLIQEQAYRFSIYTDVPRYFAARNIRSTGDIPRYTFTSVPLLSKIPSLSLRFQAFIEPTLFSRRPNHRRALLSTLSTIKIKSRR